MNDKFKISGMSCAACANRIEKGISKMEGVKEANVNFASETLTVSYDDTKVTSLDIEEKVEKLGYKIVKNIESHTYKVEGMSCSACANRVERVAKKVKGVESSAVNFATEKLTITFDTDIVSFTDIKSVVEKAGYKLIRENCNRLNELPFDSDRKLMSTVNKVDDKMLMFTKGAPDIIFSRCKYALKDGEIVDISEEIINEYKWANEYFSNKALRVLAFAMKNVEYEDCKLTLDDENELILVGLMAMIDPPRQEVYEALKEAKESGIKTIMITGDHKTTAAAIGKDIGIMEEDDLALTGEELDNLSDEELDEKLEHISVYARVSPENKIRIVKAWQRKNKITAMTGDGVNDSPALKQANIGIGMGSGTEVAKDASAMVLVDDNFATIVNAIEVGRTVYNNIKKSITYLFSGNLGGIIAILFAVMADWANPFTTIQLLFINLVTDSLPAIALGFENPEKNIMKNPPRNPEESILAGGTIRSVIVRGVIIGLVTILAQYIGMQTSPQLGTAMAFATLTLSRIIQTFASRSNSETIFSLGFTSNKYALGAVILCLIMFSMTLLPFMRDIFSIPEIFNLNNLLISFVLAISASLLMEGSKIIYDRFFKGKSF